MTRTRHGSTTQELRRDIDSGRTGDKVRVIDPAAAPLGTDEEAAGTPIDPLLVTKAREAERAGVREPVDQEWSGLAIWWGMVALLVAAGACAVAALVS